MFCLSVRDSRGRWYIGFIYSWYRWQDGGHERGGAGHRLPVTMGYAVGHWEGNTLVIRTTGTAGGRCTRRIRATAFGRHGAYRKLRILANGRMKRDTIEDPAFYSKPGMR
jgi:hypothetical protein